MRIRFRLPVLPVALVAAVVLTGCGRGASDTSTAPLAAAPSATATSPSVAPPSVAASPVAPKAASLPTPTEATVAARPDAGETRVTFALLRPSGPDGASLVATYDKVDYRSAACETASAKDQAITAYYPPSNDPANYEGEVGYAADELQILLVEGGCRPSGVG